MEADFAQDLAQQLGEFIAEKTGLHFPPERRRDLQRGIGEAAKEFGFTDAADCAHWLLSASLTRPQLHALASHLTVGETYFFRERKTFDALAEHILPDLIRRRGRERHLRLWSAACCTGEEPYSLAILLRQCIPDWRDWQISILATDINERFLKKAAAGVYGEWSFREAPPGFKERYFSRTPEGQFELLPDIKHSVKFAPLNLAEDSFPSVATDTHAMDLIFCRNVLMYFTSAQARKVVEKLRRTLLDDAWLAVSPSEGSPALFSGFAPLNFPGAILYRKQNVHGRLRFRSPAPPAASGCEPLASWIPHGSTDTPLQAPTPLSTEEEPSVLTQSAPPAPYAAAAAFYSRGRYAETAATLMDSFVAKDQIEPQVFSLLTRALANQGRLDEALTWCDRWVAAERLDSSARYLRAMVLQELGRPQEARHSLQQALYLHPDFVLAHFALGNLARGGGEIAQARKHLGNALDLLRNCPSEEPLPESDGLTAGRLREIIASLLTLETAA